MKLSDDDVVFYRLALRRMLQRAHWMRQNPHLFSDLETELLALEERITNLAAWIRDPKFPIVLILTGQNCEGGERADPEGRALPPARWVAEQIRDQDRLGRSRRRREHC